ncbi:MAG: amidase [Acidobacteriota bacterium]
MTNEPMNLHELRRAFADGRLRPSQVAEEALARSNGNPGRNTYLWQDADWTRQEARRAEAMPRGTGGPFGDGRAALWGVPIAVKDCFDLAGAPTTAGIEFYRERNGIAQRDSWMIEQLRALGAVLIGKAHLHPLAYGITGENPEFGDCIQPGTTDALTGGSSSGPAATVMEGSAVAAIGTDTGGSVRVPAALCGLAGYRASLGRGDWRGGLHLAESFDTLGWLFRDLEDAPLLNIPFAPAEKKPARSFTQFAYVSDSFLDDCEPEVAACFHAAVRELEELGLEGRAVDVGWWAESMDIFAPIQASEAAKLHAGLFDHFQPLIRDRLKWGASFTPEQIAKLRRRHAEFRGRIDELFASHELVMLPCAPISRITVAAAKSAEGDAMRKRLLRYTTPFSLAGVPCVTVPSSVGGVQIASAREDDEALLQLAAQVGRRRREKQG